MEESRFKLLIDAAKDYYDGLPYRMSDEEYDILLAEKKSEDPSFDIFKAIGYIGSPGESGDNAEHTIKFPGFGKEYCKEDLTLAEFIDHGRYADYFKEKFAEGAKLFWKYDGCSLILYYDPKTGTLEDIITRSNESIGKRRYKNFVRLVPKNIPTGIRAILCEVMVPFKFGYGFTSRNQANGLTSSKYKIDEINQKCTVIGCDVVCVDEEGNQVDFPTYEERYKILKSVPNKAVDNRITFYTANPIDPNSAVEYKITEVAQAGSVVEKFEMGADGVVLYMNDYIEAYKMYYIDSAISVVEDIEWNPTSLEQLVPNIRVEPTPIEGTTLNHCATNGVSNLIGLHIGPGSRVKIAKVGLVSPQVIRVIDGQQEVILPTCRCGHMFTKDDIMVQGLFCPNPDCICKLENRREWFKGYNRQTILKGIMAKPVDFLVKPINIHGFTTSNVDWTDEKLNICLTAIEWEDPDTYIEVINSLYHFSDLQLRCVEANTKSLMVVLKECLSR